jgi:hypothetical protein
VDMAGSLMIRRATRRITHAATVFSQGHQPVLARPAVTTMSPPQHSVSSFIPLQYWLFTPELQWQARGKWRILQGYKRETLSVEELIVRWYQMGAFHPIFRTHGHRMSGPPGTPAFSNGNGTPRFNAIYPCSATVIQG